MRMPIFSYFLVVGTVLVALFIWSSKNFEPSGSPVATTQMVGLPQPFKAPPEPSSERSPVILASTVLPVARPAKQVVAPRKEKATKKVDYGTVRNRFAAYPHDRPSIR